MAKHTTCTVEGCDAPHSCRGLCKKHHKRWLRHGDPLVVKMTEPGTLRATFDAGVKNATPDECVIWPHAKTPNGYGHMSVGDRGQLVHRLACEWMHGPGPAGFHAAHHCGVRACFNPHHLRWATPAENSADRFLHGTVPMGERHHRFIPGGRDAVRAAASLSTISDMARATGLSRSTVRRYMREMGLYPR
jgi:hypothetical protein